VRAEWDFESAEFSDDEVSTAFKVWGFVVLRNVISPSALRAARACLDTVFRSDYLARMPLLCSTEVLKLKSIWRMLFTPQIIKALKAALGFDLCYQNDFDVQRNSYGLIRWHRHTGWHMDAGSEAGNSYLTSADYRFAKCGIFLQDFDNGWGGGIRVKAKSHRAISENSLFKHKIYLLRRRANEAATRLRLDFDSLMVPTQAGDFCFFDSRLLHSSAPLNRRNIRTVGCTGRDNAKRFWPELPQEHTKYVIYWDACNALMAQDFLRNSCKRAETEMPGMTEEPSRLAIYTRILATSYPADFPPEFATHARESELSIASLPAERASFYKDKLKSMRLVHP
jgi:ectoine hydroxylase-related dioxygenase (phytanoyl-CoA dioxygenase family)